jgi:hypothetical protein
MLAGELEDQQEHVTSASACRCCTVCAVGKHCCVSTWPVAVHLGSISMRMFIMLWKLLLTPCMCCLLSLQVLDDSRWWFLACCNISPQLMSGCLLSASRHVLSTPLATKVLTLRGCFSKAASQQAAPVGKEAASVWLTNSRLHPTIHGHTEASRLGHTSTCTVQRNML